MTSPTHPNTERGLSARTPDSLTRLERKWLKRRFCSWCEAPCAVNACYAMRGDKCTDEFLNERRGKWLSEDYKPRATPTEEQL